jgi:flagellar biosynthesis activator protein FlaF
VNATEQARQAYAPARTQLRSGRSVELQIFGETTARLKSAAAATPPRFGDLADALHANRHLWTLLAVDVADEDNALQPELRARIFYLAEFTALHSSKVLRGEATVDALVEINTAVMRGLNGLTGPREVV